MEKTRRLDLRPLLAALALAFAAAALWAATALAAGGSTSSTDSATSDGTAYELVQTQEDDGTAPSPEDCPEREDGSGDSDGESSGSADA